MRKEHWKIDRRIPLAIIVTLALQIGSALIWATRLDARVSHMEEQVGASGDINEKFARLEEHLDNVRQNTAAMKHQLDTLIDQLVKR